ncbi:MAG: hypothetical protein Q9197_002352 [Variospora fuerteventurae]
MLASTTVVMLLALPPAWARLGLLQQDGRSRSIELSVCETQDPDDALRSVHSELNAQNKLRKVKPRTPESFDIDTYFHFVVTDDTSHLYNPERINKLATTQLLSCLAPLRLTVPSSQLAVLNTAYAPAGIAFKLVAPPTYTTDTAWATDSEKMAMKGALRAGTYASLNIYFQSNLSSPGAAYDPDNYLLGYCQLPTSATTTSCIVPDYPASSSPSNKTSGCTSTSGPPATYINDGCNILISTMPGGAMLTFDQGKTAVHEVGHWFGLLHTFEGDSCAKGAPGDYVDDTPQEMTATTGCPTGKDSCPGNYGLDPIANYMDYSSDAWLWYSYTNFSPQQQLRMTDLFKKYRLGN